MQPVDRVVGLDQSHDAGPLEAHGLPHEAAGELQRVGSRLADVASLVALVRGLLDGKGAAPLAKVAGRTLSQSLILSHR